jgi:hypothetical protein
MYEIQQKSFSRLSQDTELGSMTTGVFDYVPEKTKVPYVTFGRLSSSDEGSKTTDGETVELEVDIWSEGRGKKESVTILKRIEDLFKEELDLDSALLFSQKIINREVEEEAYGLYRGSLTVSFKLQWED